MRARTCVSVVVFIARKLRPCPSYSRRRDRNNSVHWRSLYKGGGGYNFSVFSKSGGYIDYVAIPVFCETAGVAEQFHFSLRWPHYKATKAWAKDFRARMEEMARHNLTHCMDCGCLHPGLA